MCWTVAINAQSRVHYLATPSLQTLLPGFAVPAQVYHMVPYIKLMKSKVGSVQVNGLPFVAFDAGGVLELFDYAANPQAIVWDPSGPALAARLQKVLTDGQMQTVQLHEHFLNGRERWLEWHTDFAVNTLRLQEASHLL